MGLLWRVFLSNAVVLVVATVALAVSPATVSFPIAITELIVLVLGLAAMLVADLVLLRRAFAPLQRLSTVMRTVDPLRPGERSHVATSDPQVSELAAPSTTWCNGSRTSAAQVRGARWPPRRANALASRASCMTRWGRR